MDIENTINGYWHDYNLSYARRDLLEKQKKSTSIVVESYKEEFRLGKRTLLDVLDAQNELHLIKVEFVKMKASVLFNKLRLVWGQGNILSNLNIKNIY